MRRRHPRYEEARRRWPNQPAVAIAYELGLNPSTVYTWAARGSWGRKPRGKPFRYDWHAIRAAFDGGADWGTVIGQFDVDEKVIANRFRRYGWPLPPKCAPRIPTPAPVRTSRRYRPTIRWCCGRPYPFLVSAPTPCPTCGRLGCEREVA